MRADTPFSADRLFRDVDAYERFGDHRTGTPPDQRTSRWIARRLSAVGFTAALQPFAHEVFALDHATLRLDDGSVDLFPAWPVRSARGQRGTLATPSTGARFPPGAIAVVRLAYVPNATLVAPAYRAPLEAAARAGAAAIVAATEGPTGEIIALNADLAAPIAEIPILLAAGRDVERLASAARAQENARLDVAGSRDPKGKAFNVIGCRPGVGRALAVSTPTSGWFRCAGERGAGVAIFLALADWAARSVPNPLTFVGTSGHEFEGAGSAHLFEALALAPEDTALWVHLGANIASRAVTITNGRAIPTDAPSLTRYAGASADVLAEVAAAFAAQPGYAQPFDIAAQKAPGDLAIYHAHGFRRILGLVGAHPLHHTRLDRAALAVSPSELVATATSLSRFIEAALPGG